MKRLSVTLSIIFLLAGFGVGYFFAQMADVRSGAQQENNFHYLPVVQKDYYDDFFDPAMVCQNNYSQAVRGLIVNHHLLAGKFIAQAFCRVATDQKITVILLSPNHFSHGDGHIIISALDWQTPNGILPSASLLVSDLATRKIAVIDEVPFGFEHGVYNIIPFIKKTIPNAEIIPIIIKEAISPAEKDSLKNFLSDNLPANSLIIASLDFSHYLPSAEADAADGETLAVINRLNLSGLDNLNPDNHPDNIDSKAVLEIFLSVMRQQQAKNFELLAHSNSAKLIGDTSLTETTSYIVGLFSGE
jgi:MEMO1 family protein